MIDLNRPIACGEEELKVRVLCSDPHNSEFPIVGAVTMEDGKEVMCRWNVDGHCFEYPEYRMYNIPYPSPYRMFITDVMGYTTRDMNETRNDTNIMCCVDVYPEKKEVVVKTKNGVVIKTDSHQPRIVIDNTVETSQPSLDLASSFFSTLSSNPNITREIEV